MSYPKIHEILPREIILQIQDYIEGAVIYIPKRSENKKQWGEGTDTKSYIKHRNECILLDYQKGVTTSALAGKYFLTEKSIQRILRQRK